MLEKQLDPYNKKNLPVALLSGKRGLRPHPPPAKFQHLGYPWLPLLSVTPLSDFLGQKARRAL
jgi:hypothetical protein